MQIEINFSEFLDAQFCVFECYKSALEKGWANTACRNKAIWESMEKTVAKITGGTVRKIEEI